MSISLGIRVRRVLAVLAVVGLIQLSAQAMDGFVIGIHHQAQKSGDIHDSSTPGQLLRYDIAADKPAGTKILYDAEPRATNACLDPFGKRVVFCRADGTLAIVSLGDGQVAEIGRFIPADRVKKDQPVDTGLQWPATDGGKWIYYTSFDNNLVRIDTQTQKQEVVVTFNRAASGEFALSQDATPNSGTFVKRTDNYAVVIYDMAKGDGDLWNAPVWAPGCGISISPDGSLFAANAGDHASVALVDVHAKKQGGFRISQFDGDPTKGVTDRAKFGWAWQFFRWATNSMEWISVKQARLVGNSFSEIKYSDIMVYDWVKQRQINLTNNKDGTFDRPNSMWVNQQGEQLIGYFRGEAPYTVEISDPRLAGSMLGGVEGDFAMLRGVTWDFGDGSPKASAGLHTFKKDGVFTVIAQRGADKFRAQVTVLPRVAPKASPIFMDARHLMVEFDEPVTQQTAKVRLASGQAAQWTLSSTGRQLQAVFAEPIGQNPKLVLDGFTDRAQKPNELASSPIAIDVPAWPTNREGAIYAWNSAKQNNYTFDELTNQPRFCRLRGDFDRTGWLQLRGGQAHTGIFSACAEGKELQPTITANRISIEAMIQPEALSPAPAGEFPRRIVNCSYWHENDWSFMVGQQSDRLVCSIRTVNNFLSTDGQKIKEALHGRAPVFEFAKLTDTAPHHLVITYEPGHLIAYMDGKKVTETDTFTGNLAFGPGELVFGGHHNGGRYRWRGKMRNMAIYARALSPEEVAANYAAIKAATKPLPQITLRAKLLATSKVPSAESIAPYTEALVVNEYQVTDVTKRSNDWQDKPKVAPGEVIRVYQWGMLQKKPTAVAELKVGDVRDLVLESYANHPAKLEEVVTSDELELGVKRPSLYEPD